MLGRDCRKYIDTHLNPPLPPKRTTSLLFEKISCFHTQKNLNLQVSLSRIVFILSTGQVLINPTDTLFKPSKTGNFGITPDFLVLNDPQFVKDLRELDYQSVFITGRLRSTDTLVWVNVNHVLRATGLDSYHEIDFGTLSMFFNTDAESGESRVVLQVEDLNSYQIGLMNNEKWEEICL